MKASPRPRLNVEHLESRDVPSVSVPTFNITAPPALPTGWSQWSSNGSTAFTTATGAGPSGSAGVVSTGESNTGALAWDTQSQPAGTAISAEVDLTTLVPTYLFTSGTNLGTSTPSYLAAVVTRGVSVSLVQVTGGEATVIATVSSPPSAYFSGNWVQVSLVPDGSTVGVQVVRQDTGQYLNAQGTWQTAATNVITASSTLADSAGEDGFGRFPAYFGAVDLADIAIDAPASPVSPAVPPSPPPPSTSVSQTFDTTAVGATPAGWQSWVSNSAGTAGVSSALSYSAPNGYAFSGASNTSARAWAATTLPAATTASADIYSNSLNPTQLFVDGANLNTAAPTYDAVNLTRGLQASLVQVANGSSKTLASVNTSSAGYLSGEWVQAVLTVQGADIEVSIQRLDTDQWLTASGTWTSGPTYAMSVSTAPALAAGDAGIGMASGYAGTVSFDNFSAGPAGSIGPTLTVSPNPTSAVGYAPPPSTDTLFGPNGPSPLDVHQGDEGDCWLMSGLAEVAARDPQAIENMFTYDGTVQEGGSTVGVYTVRFYNASGAQVSVTIDSQLPDGGSWYDQPVNGVLWPALAEKAYAVANGLGYVTSGEADTASYAALNSGYPAWAIQAITGQSAANSAINPTQMAADWKAGDLIVLSTSTPASSEIVSGHNYTVVGYDASTGEFELLNPWGGSTTSTACTQDAQVYGLFYATPSFISANFDLQTITSPPPSTVTRND